jgi:hypothetical protein
MLGPVAGGLALVAVGVLIGVYLGASLHRKLVETRHRMMVLAYGLEWYKVVLSGADFHGENPKRQAFLDGRMGIERDVHGRPLDAWGTPFRISRLECAGMSPRIEIVSCGPNATYERGGLDDLMLIVD